MRSQSARHARALNDALAACDERHAALSRDRRRRDAELAATLRAALPGAKAPPPRSLRRSKASSGKAQRAPSPPLDPPATIVDAAAPGADRARDSLRRAVAAVDDLYNRETGLRPPSPAPNAEGAPPGADADAAWQPARAAHWPPPPPTSRPRVTKVPLPGSRPTLGARRSEPLVPSNRAKPSFRVKPPSRGQPAWNSDMKV